MALIQCADMIYKRAMKELKGDYEERIGKTYDLIYNAINKKLENDFNNIKSITVDNLCNLAGTWFKNCAIVIDCERKKFGCFKIHSISFEFMDDNDFGYYFLITPQKPFELRQSQWPKRTVYVSLDICNKRLEGMNWE